MLDCRDLGDCAVKDDEFFVFAEGMGNLAVIFVDSFFLEAFIGALLSLAPKLGRFGQKIVDNCATTPWIDILITAILWMPWVFGIAAGGFRGFLVALVAQLTALNIWALVHGMAYSESRKGPGIADFHNRRVGWLRNNIAVWSTVLVIPLFSLIRLAQVVVYPMLIWTVNFPRYNHGDWINVSRQKFSGLIGYDLIWCLYCDWMTGVYSLGAEMLRNVESFWCPIRFYEGKKCANCTLDFPDIAHGWVDADKDMQSVTQLLVDKYGKHEPASWFGHPGRDQAP